jgi:hypothetical protein
MPKLQPISTINTNSVKNSQLMPPKLKPILQIVLKNNNKTSPKANLNKNNSNNENLSLKFKFCPGIFKGQTNFIQHMINYVNNNPEILRERFNRNNSNTSPNNSKNSLNKVKVN